METERCVKEKTKAKTRVSEPKKYVVVMHNDDFTTMDFVVYILVELFGKDIMTANQLMLKIHNTGRAEVGRYSYDIAKTKADEAMDRARAEGFPLRVTVEAES